LSISATDIDNGALKFVPVSNANDGNAAKPTFTFQVQDNGGVANNGQDTDLSPNTITVSVTSVNDAPSSLDDTINLAPGSTDTFSVNNFAVIDANDNPPNVLLAIKVTSLPPATEGSYTLGASAVS